MKIIIAGCGKVGATIVEQLSAEGHEIAVVDTMADVVNDISTSCDVLGVIGNTADYQVLKKAGAEDADLLVAVTNSDEINLLSCLLAKKLGNCKTIARVRNPVYSQEIMYFKEDMGLSMTINPELEAANEMSRILRIPSVVSIDTFSGGKVELMGYVIPEGSILAGKSVIEARKIAGVHLLFCAVERDDEVIIPGGYFVFKEKDTIHFAAKPADARVFFKNIGVDVQKITNVMIIGGGTLAYYLARLIRNMGIKVKIIEQDRERCEELEALLPEAIIICGDATNQALLLEEGIEETDAFISLTGIDEENVFLSLYARDVNPDAKRITKINKLSFENVINSFDIGSIICPKEMTAESIVRYVRALKNGEGSNVESLHRIVKNKAEALEFIISRDAPVCGIPIRDLNIKPGILVGAIIRGKDVFYPDGDTMIMPKDRVIVVTTINGLHDVSDIVEV